MIADVLIRNEQKTNYLFDLFDWLPSDKTGWVMQYEVKPKDDLCLH